MDHVIAARAQMGTSLGFHIIFAALGVGLPLLLLIVEGLWLRTHDETYYRIARVWAKAMAVLFAVGAVSGTVLSFEIGLLFPEFMKHAGGIIGIPFSAEGFAFFVEAIFIGLYLYGWDRLSPLAHWLCCIPIAVSGVLSALFIVCANAWMNDPTGFRIVNGKVTDVDPIAAMFNPAWPTEVLHSSLAAYVFVGFSVAAIYAWSYLRGRRTAYILTAMRVAMMVGAVAIPLQLVAGDISARFDAHEEPWKLAAMEGIYHTHKDVGLTIGGIPDPATQTEKFGIEIPYLLSFLSFEDPHATIKGLDAFPASDQPPPIQTHLSFQAMVGAGSLLLVIAAWWFFTARKRTAVPNVWLTRAIAVSGPLAFVALEAGWFVTEFGRQPWIVHGFLRTADTVTTAPGLDIAFYAFSLLYVVLAAVTWWLLARIAKAEGTHPTPDGKLVAA